VPLSAWLTQKSCQASAHVVFLGAIPPFHADVRVFLPNRVNAVILSLLVLMQLQVPPLAWKMPKVRANALIGSPAQCCLPIEVCCCSAVLGGPKVLPSAFFRAKQDQVHFIIMSRSVSATVASMFSMSCRRRW
jgi:hypothetical protein